MPMPTPRLMLRSLGGAILLLSAPMLSSAQPQDGCTPDRVSLDTGGGNPNDYSALPSISPDGDWVVFQSDASDLVSGDTNGFKDIFLRQISTGVTTLVSRGPGGVLANGESIHPVVSENGDYVAFYSEASNISHNNDTNGFRDAFIYERAFNRVRRISFSPAAGEGNGNTGAGGLRRGIDISDDGQFVVFSSSASNLVPGDTNHSSDIFVYVNSTGVLRRVSSLFGNQSNGSSQNPVISGNGVYVAYMSSATNLGSVDTNSAIDIYYTQVVSLQTRRISESSSGGQALGNCWSPSINYDGTVIAYDTIQGGLVPGDTNGVSDVFVTSLPSGITERASLAWDGQQGNNYSYISCLSGDGGLVGFVSAATNLSPDGGGIQNVYVRDRALGTVERWGEREDGANIFASSTDPSFDSLGQRMCFASLAPLVSADTNNKTDVYVTNCGPTGTSYCGGATVACPCGNTGGFGRGCKNSTAGLGALLQAHGRPQVSLDTTYLTVFDVGPTVPVLFFEGEVLLNGGAGLPFGDGVRCVSANIQRLGVKIASGGYAVFGTGADGPVSIGLPVIGGVRYYQAWYRDTINYCTSATFNVSNTVEIFWQP